MTDLLDAPSTDKNAEEHADWATTRFGLAGHAVYYLVLALLVGRVALGGGDADTQGAVSSLASKPFGQALMVPLVIAFVAYAGHHALEAYRADGWPGRVSYTVRALVWAGLSVVTTNTLMQGFGGGSGSSGGSSSTSLTQKVLELPGGQWIVGAFGLVILGVAIYQGYKAQRSDLANELEEIGISEQKAATWLGRVGYGGRALAYAVMGGFIVHAAVTRDPSEAGGLDKSLSQLREAAFGTPLLLLIAACLLAFAAFRFVEARYRGTD